MFGNKPEISETPLVLGDYVMVHVSSIIANQVNSAEPRDMQVHREELFQRIQKQRGENFRRLKKQGGVLVDPRHRGAA
jgi:sRNA-binding carbon storage regulator CsrA